MLSESCRELTMRLSERKGRAPEEMREDQKVESLWSSIMMSYLQSNNSVKDLPIFTKKICLNLLTLTKA
jgi:hypothetical protein